MPKHSMKAITFAALTAHYENNDCPVDFKTTRLCYATDHGEIEIDESLYSRQLYVLGHDSMKRMSAASVLISGMGGLGAEIAKNVILSGVRRVVLHDKQAVSLGDLSSQFYLSEADVGKNRAEACHGKFAELNSYVLVEHSARDLTPESLLEFQVVVLCNYLSFDEILPVADCCHETGIKFILASTRGLFGQIFCDFGEDFTVIDTNGEEPFASVIESITNDKENGIVTLTDNGGRGFSEGDSVVFHDVRGAVGINECGPIAIKSIINPFVFSIGDTSGFGQYKGGGVATQTKEPVSMSFKSLRHSLTDPDFVTSDFAKIDRQAALHLAFYCLSLFTKFRKGALPEPRNASVAKQFVDFCKQTNYVDPELFDEKLLFEFASQAAGDICPMNAVIGGITAQEIMKSVSGKFTPIHQWFYFDALECLPTDRSVLTEKECAPRESRYDSEIAVFGQSFVEKLAQQKLFLVGAGALGCEMLKNWSMMGIACSPAGKITVTDMDLIERSNLNRQFLFRKTDLQQPKSECVAAASRNMNPQINIVAHRNRVGSESEEIYNDDFFNSLDVVVNALDNVDARKYVDNQCVFYRKPLLESGTLGTKANIQVILPDLTESYSSSQDPPEKSYPICTIKNFPSAIEHTLQWARELFENSFKASMFHVIQYINDHDFAKNISKSDSSHARSIIVSMKRLLVVERPHKFEDCVAWARLLWEDNFHNKVMQMLFNFPPNSVTSEGIPFWSGSKRLPRVANFDVSDPWHLNFVVAGANLRARMFGLEQVRDKTRIIDMISRVSIPVFVPKSNVTFKDFQDREKDSSTDCSDNDDHGTSIKEMLLLLPRRESLADCNFKVIEFEKDDDTNFHMDFITAASNSRAEVYDIPQADKYKSKMIAGRIIPAIATTTSVAVGLVCLELYKLIQNHRDIEQYKNGFINLALPFFAFSTPLEPKSLNFVGKKWNLWDRFVVKGEPTLGELIDQISEEHKVTVTMLSSGVVICYNDMMDKKKQHERKAMRLGQILEAITGKKLPPWQHTIVLDICCEDAEGNEIYEAPSIHYVLNNTDGQENNK